jgi:sugar fermentation stimulation protein A
VEIKNCTLVENEQALFPDAVTLRGKKHLVELQALVKQGYRCVMFYLIQRMDAQKFSPADKIDPDYGKELRKALSNGVEMLAYDVRIDYERIKIHRRIPCNL